ncbi:hypothetical protein [Subdoligranulum variabile]|uniref:Tat pathway signal sequence domain protein n=1 Tax=Subdoligranulum variabile DSM 15176 TaxID=411471 RepID=D1PIU3_9FIRM|nr:hypothetical protein [Subdoligranulum variabile]EFB77452.1 hypothetical protein SUBVAR_04258 [Subdoligranulum variabile DSM 15176]UWP67339.1 hypothetical protein NQ490_10335 [Subdoligranulum variabile]
MSLWQHPRFMAGLCTAAVLVCAAAPAVFLTAVDAAVLGRSASVQNAYEAPTPRGEDYYILRQLTARQQQSAAAYAPPEEEDRTSMALKMYIGAQNSLESMVNGYDYMETVSTTLQSLAERGVIDVSWAQWATDWGGNQYYEGYNGQTYALDVPYYATDSLGFVTLKRFALDQGSLYTVFSLTMDSRTGVVTQLWISAPREDDTAPAAPDEAGLRAFADLAGLESLGDWAVPDQTPYTHALYSANGAALITATVSPYQYTGWANSSSVVSDRWFLSLSLEPCTPEELPTLVS